MIINSPSPKHWGISLDTNVCIYIHSPRGYSPHSQAKVCTDLGCNVFSMEKKSISHYSSSQKILLVGEGDFSFSLCLARAFGTAKNMVATTLDTRGTF